MSSSADQGRAAIAGGTAIVADVRNAPLLDESVDLVLCISTIEHIGRENDVYGTSAEEPERRADIDSLMEMSRWLRPGGRLLLSVPFGKFEDHGWLVNYDEERLTTLVAASALSVVSERYFELAGGWVERNKHDVTHRGYRSLGAPHAGAVALLELKKEKTP